MNSTHNRKWHAIDFHVLLFFVIQFTTNYDFLIEILKKTSQGLCNKSDPTKVRIR